MFLTGNLIAFTCYSTITSPILRCIFRLTRSQQLILGILLVSHEIVDFIWNNLILDPLKGNPIRCLVSAL